MPGMITTRDSYTDTSKLRYVKPHIEERESANNNCRQYQIKLSKLCINYLR